VGFENQPHYDERPYAARVAERFGAKHRELVLHPRQVIDCIPQLVHGQDEPLSDWVCLPLQLLARLVRDSGVIVVQVGEGSDELFAGYPRYRRYAAIYDRFWRPYLRLPRPLREAVSAMVGPALAGSSRLREPRDLFRRAARDEPLFLSGAVVNWDGEKAALFTREASQRLAPTLSSSAVAMRNLERFHAEAPAGDFSAAMAYQDLMVRLPELLLMRVDKMTMLSSVEARVPFLDHRIVELGMGLSGALKLRNGRTKHVLKVVAEEFLGSAVIDRPKKGFDVPLAAWLREEPLTGWARHTLFESRLLSRGLLDGDAIRGLFGSHIAGRADNAFRIWNLLNLCAWYDHWVDRTP